jgi:hypothetical protein
MISSRLIRQKALTTPNARDVIRHSLTLCSLFTDARNETKGCGQKPQWLLI